MTRWRITQGLVLPYLQGLEDNSRDAALMDNPYGLGDEPEPADIVRFLTAGASLSTGDFMGSGWEIPSIATWREIARVLKPGALLYCFGGSRTFDLVSLGARMAGLRFADTTAWLYAQGKANGHSISNGLEAADPEEAARWEGHSTRLKPAWEPAMLFQKPREGTFAENAMKWGVGGINIDGARVHGPPLVGGQRGDGMGYGGASSERIIDRSMASGRWPCNVALDEAMADVLDKQAGERKSGAMRAGTPRGQSVACYGASSGAATKADIVASTGSASRFMFVAKASRRERDAGCHHLPMRDGVRNHHACVKPISLTRYLATQLLPPPRRDGEPRRIVVPYSGSGSEIIGAGLAGWEEVDGVEREADYVEIANARCVHWLDKGLAAKDAPPRGRGTSVRVGGQKTRECRVCQCRTAEPGAGGRWPACEHDDWAWVPRLKAEPAEAPVRGQMALF
jgi:hypothetical protein